MSASPYPPSRWLRPPLRMGLLGLLLLLGIFSPPIPLADAEASGVLRQVVDGDEGGTFFEPFNVTYDHRALIIGGKRRMLISAGLHYPRATPEMWPSLIKKCKEGDVDVIETYVFWNGHEPAKGQYYFEGRFDIVRFAKLVAAEGLFLFLRIGPYACAEWNFGGFPVWLRDIPGIEFRTDNEPYKAEMQTFVTKIVDIMKEEKLYSWQGGPIILQQIENEYGNIQGHYGQAGKRYMQWAAQMALALDTGVPWVMCRQTDAPEQILDTCNAFYCDGFKPNSYNKPTIWTEDWDGWYADWGESLPHRPAQDSAFAVARFYQRGGSLQNYYMYFGGTNFELLHFLGISVTRSSDGLFLSQRQYAVELLQRAGMAECHSTSTPVDSKTKLSASDGAPVADPSEYRRLAGALQYLTLTRPDLAYAVQQACLFMHDPREPHLALVKRILRYVKGTLSTGLHIGTGPVQSLTAYSDADWAGCPNSRRSTSGYCVYLGDNLLSWSSKRQSTVSRSSAEAEYRAVAHAVAECCWVRQLLQELHLPFSSATIVFCDNVSAVYMTANPVHHRRTKHIEIDIHFVREKVALVLHVPSSHQFADIMTKGLPVQLFTEFRSSLCVRNSPVSTAGGC